MPDFENVWITPQIALKIKKARVDRGISPVELANQLDASPAQIEKYERGEVDMALDRLFDLARILTISPADLLADEAD
ncbi:MAG: helix-turn-helix transcriptional regulator [Eubacteriales bacterium]|nr:helix-turn-helix transcriptional regulator [Eubacteriales bacterium]